MSNLKSPSFNIPNFDNLYAVLCDFVKEHQGDKGYIATDSFDKENKVAYGSDTIYGFEYSDFSGVGEEQIVFGVRVRNDDIEVLMRPWMRSYHNAPSEDEIADDNSWSSLRYSDVYYIPTLINICECIEEYVEE